MADDRTDQSGETGLSEVRDRIVRLARIWDEESVEPAEDFADALLADLGIQQVGWRQENGSFCFGHDHHHRLDGVKWCEPVYVFVRNGL